MYTSWVIELRFHFRARVDLRHNNTDVRSRKYIHVFRPGKVNLIMYIQTYIQEIQPSSAVLFFPGGYFIFTATPAHQVYVYASEVLSNNSHQRLSTCRIIHYYTVP
ncbi:hypothetical protein VTN02DRAFT_624 [Thermoascus thermophilus]